MNRPYMNRPYGIFPVKFPSLGIVHDVFPDVVERLLVADDVFVIIALPDRNARYVAHFIDSFLRLHQK